MDITSIIGYSASVFLILSFMFKDIIKLRIMNTVGCALFVIYGFLLDNNWPIIIPNVFIMAVNIYQLLKSKRPLPTEN